jgi:imidazolonepropionase
MADKGVISTLLPGTAFCLKEEYANGRKMIDEGCAVALATDLNPGSSFTNSIPLIIALAALYMNLSPEEILTALTLNSAAALDRVEETGSIDPGKKADILILDYPSYKFLPYYVGVNIVKTVIKDGKIVQKN